MKKILQVSFLVVLLFTMVDKISALGYKDTINKVDLRFNSVKIDDVKTPEVFFTNLRGTTFTADDISMVNGKDYEIEFAGMWGGELSQINNVQSKYIISKEIVLSEDSTLEADQKYLFYFNYKYSDYYFLSPEIKSIYGSDENLRFSQSNSLVDASNNRSSFILTYSVDTVYITFDSTFAKGRFPEMTYTTNNDKVILFGDYLYYTKTKAYRPGDVVSSTGDVSLWARFGSEGNRIVYDINGKLYAQLGEETFGCATIESTPLDTVFVEFPTHFEVGDILPEPTFTSTFNDVLLPSTQFWYDIYSGDNGYVPLQAGEPAVAGVGAVRAYAECVNGLSLVYSINGKIYDEKAPFATFTVGTCDTIEINYPTTIYLGDEMPTPEVKTSAGVSSVNVKYLVGDLNLFYPGDEVTELGDVILWVNVTSTNPYYFIVNGVPTKNTRNVYGGEVIEKSGDPSAIFETVLEPATVVEIFDVYGRKLENPLRGMCILRLSNGKTIKAIIK